MEGRYKVGEIMVQNVVAARPHESIFQCAQKMRSRKVGALVVMDDVAVAGIITEQDIVRKVVAQGLIPRATPVSTVMSTNIISVDASRDIRDAIALMGDKGVKHLPVIENGQLLGIITAKDIVAIEPVLIEMLKFNSNPLHKKADHFVDEEFDEIY